LKLANEFEQKKAWLIIALLGGVLFIVTAFLLWKQIAKRNKLQSIAYLDDLTKAPNRRAILSELSNRFGHAKDENAGTSAKLLVAIADLDRFKKLNDTYGHASGDQALIKFAEVTKEVLREEDAFGRFGGEEWLFVFRSADVESVQRSFGAIKERINAEKIDGLPNDHIITFSMGIAIFDSELDKNYKSLVERADTKLYEAKQNGRDQVAF
jgi:diguanylate cyclase (GGDEF)-like protein